jgi:DNA recombination protein RmuC
MLHERLAVAAEHLKRVGTGLSTAVNNYNSFVSSFERNVLSTGREFKRLAIETGKRDEIETVPAVEALPRYGSAESASILVESVVTPRDDEDLQQRDEF